MIALADGDTLETADGLTWLVRSGGRARAARLADVTAAVAMLDPAGRLEVTRVGHAAAVMAGDLPGLLRAVRRALAPCAEGACARCDGERREHVSRSPAVARVVLAAVQAPAQSGHKYSTT